MLCARRCEASSFKAIWQASSKVSGESRKSCVRAGPTLRPSRKMVILVVSSSGSPITADVASARIQKQSSSLTRAQKLGAVIVANVIAMEVGFKSEFECFPRWERNCTRCAGLVNTRESPITCSAHEMRDGHRDLRPRVIISCGRVGFFNFKEPTVQIFIFTAGIFAKGNLDGLDRKSVV